MKSAASHLEKSEEDRQKERNVQNKIQIFQSDPGVCVCVYKIAQLTQ